MGISRTPLILALLISISGNTVPAQEKPPADAHRSIADEILAHPESDVSILGKSRAVLLEALQAADTAKARKVLAYMEERFDTSKVVILFSGEELLVSYWLNEYEKVFAFARRDQVGGTNDREMMIPERDFLYDHLREISREARSRLADGIRSEGGPPEKRDFLQLFLKALMGPEQKSEIERSKFQEEVNAEADEYLLTYRDAEFIPFIRHHLRYVLATSRWGIGYEFSAGYLGLPTALAAHLKDYFLLTLGLDVTYDQWYAGARIDIGAAQHLRKGFEYDGSWKEGLLVMQLGGLLNVGRMIPLGNNFTVTPTLGVGIMEFSPPSEGEGNDLSLSFATWAVGTNLDFPLGGASGATYLRLQIGHRSALTGNPLVKGGYTFITLGVELFSRSTYRDE